MASLGIWGFGICGKSVLRYLSNHPKYKVRGICDTRLLSEEECKLIPADVKIYGAGEEALFLQNHDYIVPSPGIDIRNYRHFHQISELDLFLSAVNKPYVVITGSIGKTSITHLLAYQLQKNGINAHACGNIGIPLLDALDSASDMLICELSSFQLEQAQLPIKAELGIITNIYPNHLDRHESWASYCNAKLKIKDAKKILIPPQLQDYVSIHQNVFIFSKNFIPSQRNQFYIHNNYIQQSEDPQIQHGAIPPHSYRENWLIVGAALTLLDSKPKILHSDVNFPPHRLEYIGHHNEIHFYNDSKSTVNESTLAAVECLKTHKLILLIGGVSKGVSRDLLFQQLKKYALEGLFIFGKERDVLTKLAKHYELYAEAYDTLEAAFNNAIIQARPGMTILLSPGGTSYDLFENFEQRGNRFKELVNTLQNDNNTR